MRATHENDAAPLAGDACATEGIVQVKPSVSIPNPPSHHNAPAGTSHVAAQRVSGKAKSLRAAVLDVLTWRGAIGATDQEMQEILGLPPNAQTPRRWELVNAGRVIASKLRRPTRSGCPATVWVLTCYADAAAVPEEVAHG
jgi:hypothetical protein